MTEPTLPGGDAPAACPFVAFEDDRDHRAAAADHRHRCYAEVRPAVRSIAHQDAYCVSAAFPACPTFLEWARREAAVARSLSPEAATGRDGGADPISVVPPAAPARRGRRDWAAPPPWATGTNAADGDRSGGSAGGGLGASATFWLGPEERTGSGTGDGDAGAELPPAIDPRDASLPPSMRTPPAAARSPFAPGVRPWERTTAADALGRDDDELDDDEPDEEPRARPGRRARRPAVSAAGSRRSGTARAARNVLGRVRSPEWEAPIRREAYPSLRLRLGMPAVSPVGLWFAALLVAAAVLFFVPPMLLGLGGGETATPTPVPTERPTEPPASPTPEPSPTPRLYVVVSGDTLGRIADRFGVTVADLMAANPSITNENVVKLGQEIVIPTAPPETIPDGSTVDGATTVPDAGTSPAP